ncbi:MAG: DNA adenine methylase [Verrucomicrobia bacterium]|nr:DNA adenine methylase [Verrucomicrobiota bacterium]
MFDDAPEPQLPKVRPVIGWPGGKGKLLKHLLPHVPEHTQYCEVFGGGLALLLAKPRSDIEVVNDINGDLVQFYRCCKYHLDALLDELDLVLNSRRDFEDYGAQPGLTDIQRASRWFIRNRLSFAGMGAHFAISRKQPLGSRAQRLLAIRSLNRRLDRTTIEQRPWPYILDAYDSTETFFFFDPPYLDSGGAAYAGWSEHELARFCARVAKLRGQWLFTFQDCQQVRDLMAGHQIRGIVRANGIGNNNGRTGRKYREVLITSERDEVALARKECAS